MSLPSEAATGAAGFAGSLPFEIDGFQRDALEGVEGAESVLVSAPTGSGKTVVGEFACWLALRSGAKCFYTTPVKALSNQKFGDLARTHGPDAVGLLTGDNTINGEAPIVVMTTEVLRNMLYEHSETLRGLRYVVLDEVHYLQDPYRGAVWEEVLIHLPPEVQVVSLSATISNVDQFGDWLRTLRGPTRIVVERKRPVELRNLVMVGEELHPMLVERSHDGQGIRGTVAAARAGEPGVEVNPDLVRAWAKGTAAAQRYGHRAGGRKRAHDRVYTPSRVEVAEILADEGMLPAICFIFSRIGCDKAVEACIYADLWLTSEHEADEIVALVEERTAELDRDDLRALRYDTFLDGLRRGVAGHHAGMLPIFKEVVEELFARGLVKLAFATETLALGINMPAKTVVIERLTKFTGERHELLTPTDYTQLTGRAGRRGMDEVGYGVVLFTPWVPIEKIASLATLKAYELTSSFRLSYNMAVNLVRNHPPEVAEHVLNSSFAQFVASKDVVRVEKRLGDLEREAADLRERASCEQGDALAYRELRAEAEEGRNAERGGPEVKEAFARLGPGDVLWPPGLGKALVCEQPRTPRSKKNKRGAEVTVMTLDRKLRKVGPRDFRTPPIPVGRIRLKGQSWRSPKVRKDLSRVLDRLDVDRQSPVPGPKRVRELVEAYESHPVHACPDRDEHMRLASDLEKAEREIERLRKRIRRERNTIAREFERVLSVLRTLGYVHDWALAPKGELLARVYNESDLLVVECLERGWFRGLDAVELAAVLSLFTYEPRGKEEPESSPTPHLARYERRISDLYASLLETERSERVQLLKEPDGGFMSVVHEWAAGASLETVLQDRPLSAGDFVRHTKQVLDLAQQLRQVVQEPDLAEILGEAVDRIQRGVVGWSPVG